MIKIRWSRSEFAWIWRGRIGSVVFFKIMPSLRRQGKFDLFGCDNIDVNTIHSSIDLAKKTARKRLDRWLKATG